MLKVIYIAWCIALAVATLVMVSASVYWWEMRATGQKRLARTKDSEKAAEIQEKIGNAICNSICWFMVAIMGGFITIYIFINNIAR